MSGYENGPVRYVYVYSFLEAFQPFIFLMHSGIFMNSSQLVSLWCHACKTHFRLFGS